MELLRIIVQGRVCELLNDNEESLEVDLFLKKLQIYHYSRIEAESLDPSNFEFAKAYCEGVNQAMKAYRPSEFKLIKHQPSPWLPEDIISTMKIMAYLGLAQTQQEMQKFIIQSIQQGVQTDFLQKLLSPHAKELTEINDLIDLIKKVQLFSPAIPDKLFHIPKLISSNNWVLAGHKTSSGQTIACADPHLEVNRLPAIWYECKFNLQNQDKQFAYGISMPGVPGIIMGRNQDISFSFTYGYMDTIDYFIEDIKGKCYQDESIYKELIVRKETIKRKKMPHQEVILYQSENGILEEDNSQGLSDGLYLSSSWSGLKQGANKALSVMEGMFQTSSVKEAQTLSSHLFISCNWLFSDTQGDIGYQQSGLLPKRYASGIIPLPGWSKKYRWKGIHPTDALNSILNPKEGFLITANNNMNKDEGPVSINLSAGGHRYERIKTLLSNDRKFNIEDMKSYQSDLCSLQAKHYMELMAPHIANTPSGRILKEWDFCYRAESKAAFLFEKFYSILLQNTFGNSFFGTKTWSHFEQETLLLQTYHTLFDDFLFNLTDNEWIHYFNKDKESILKSSLSETFSKYPSGKLLKWRDINSFSMINIFFQGKLPRILRFDRGPYPLQGSRATISQGTLLKSKNRITTFAPSWRFVTDMNENYSYTSLAGGVKAKRFSRLYTSDIKLWLNFQYKSVFPD